MISRANALCPLTIFTFATPNKTPGHLRLNKKTDPSCNKLSWSESRGYYSDQLLTTTLSAEQKPAMILEPPVWIVAIEPSFSRLICLFWTDPHSRVSSGELPRLQQNDVDCSSDLKEKARFSHHYFPQRSLFQIMRRLTGRECRNNSAPVNGNGHQSSNPGHPLMQIGEKCFHRSWRLGKDIGILHGTVFLRRPVDKKSFAISMYRAIWPPTSKDGLDLEGT